MDFQRSCFRREIYVAFLALLIPIVSYLLENPKFSEPIKNVTVPVGREAILACAVEDLGTYKVAWLRVDTQTILTIHSHLITKSNRFSVSHSENKTWFLHIKDVQRHDSGWYMCQINTDPMKSQVGYLDVVAPPDIIDDYTSSDLVAEEGTNVTLRCLARGHPQPHIRWKKYNGDPIKGMEVVTQSGSFLMLEKVRREDMGPYLCIASNGVPPSISKQIMLVVIFPPSIYVPNQLIGTYDDQNVVLECLVESFPKSINYWTNDKGEFVPGVDRFRSEIVEKSNYQAKMTLSIWKVTPSDYKTYHCVSKNTLGDAEGTVKLYYIDQNIHLNQQSGNGIYLADLSQKDSLFLGDVYYNSALHQVNHLTSTMLLSSLGTFRLLLRPS